MTNCILRCIAMTSIGSMLSIALPAAATPLDAAACDQLRQQIIAAAKSPVRANFAKGVGWAMANLKPEQLGEIEQLIDIEQQFLFRCPQPRRKLDAATEHLMENGTGSDPDPDAPKPPSDATGGTPPTVPPAKAKAAKAKSAAAPPADAPAAAGEAPSPKPKRTPKPKSADAYAPQPKPKSGEE